MLSFLERLPFSFFFDWYNLCHSKETVNLAFCYCRKILQIQKCFCHHDFWDFFSVNSNQQVVIKILKRSVHRFSFSKTSAIMNNLVNATAFTLLTNSTEDCIKIGGIFLVISHVKDSIISTVYRYIPSTYVSIFNHCKSHVFIL